jgi:hypothetical protein
VLTSDYDNVRVMNFSQYNCYSVGISLWLPVLPRKLFNFLGNQNSRNEVLPPVLNIRESLFFRFIEFLLYLV